MDKRYRKRIEPYWQQCERSALACIDRLDIKSWFDYWHTHVDWKGKGNRCPESRRRVIEIGYGLLQVLEQRNLGRQDPLQRWMTVAENAADDAVWMHSPNPNGTPFPHDFAGVEWDFSDHEVLNELVDLRLYRIGRICHASGTLYVVVARESGQIR